MTYRALAEELWAAHGQQFVPLRQEYGWPRGATSAEAEARRGRLEALVQEDVRKSGELSKATFSEVLEWGFGRVLPDLEPETIRRVTRRAYDYQREGDIEAAALALMEPRGMGISRASKFLALRDPESVGVYDSHAANGLTDMMGARVCGKGRRRGKQSGICKWLCCLQRNTPCHPRLCCSRPLRGQESGEGR